MSEINSNSAGSQGGYHAIEGVFRKTYAQNPVYMLLDESLFYETSFKVMLGEDQEYFLPCISMKENGSRCLVFLTRGYSLLSDRIGEMTEEEILGFLRSFVRIVSHVNQNGFLTVSMIQANPNDVYIGDSDCHAKLMYLPLRDRAAGQVSNDRAIQSIRDGIAQYVMGKLIQPSTTLDKACKMLADASISIDQYSGKLEQMIGNATETDQQIQERMQNGNHPVLQGTSSKSIVLSPLDNGSFMDIVVDKADYWIGRSAKINDTVIPNSAVSRKHCKIIEDEIGFSIVDLGSSYGTFVNGVCLKANVPVQLFDGDEVSIAGVVFRVRAGVEER